jgi:hypothetical protein
VVKSKIYRSARELATATKTGEINPVFRQDFGAYAVLFHNQELSKLARAQYKKEDLAKVAKSTAASRAIKTLASINGEVVPADAHDIADVDFDTHYDSIWIRDNCWSYLALRIQDPNKAKAVLLTEVNYLVSQRQRIEGLIAEPKKLSENNTIHIRFDASREGFGDVLENGEVQPWNNLQNDAVGFLLDSVINALREQEIELSDEQLDGILLTFAYLAATKFWRQADAGPWEEAIRRNTSSIALCTSAFENLKKMTLENRSFKKVFQARVRTLGLDSLLSDTYLTRVIKSGYRIIRKQIKDGGESPSYNKNNPKFRRADAALLNVIFPAKLPRLATKYKVQVLRIVAELVREHGIIRYVGDTYQAGNFWFNDIHTDCDPKQYARRRDMFIKGSEAEWFFDSWYSISALKVYSKTRDDEFIYLATKHFNRALGQYTGVDNYKANGHPCGELELPESYNFLVADKEKLAAASPMTPLNWAKAMQTLMLDQWQKFLEK